MKPRLVSAWYGLSVAVNQVKQAVAAIATMTHTSGVWNGNEGEGGKRRRADRLRG